MNAINNVFVLGEHSCPKNNEVHQKRCDELLAILKSVEDPPTEKLVLLNKRIGLALPRLRETNLWQRFRTEEKLDAVAVMNRVAEWIQQHEPNQDPLACDGCHSLRMFYAFGPFYIVQALIEALGDTQGLGEAEMRLFGEASDRLEAEVNTTINIAQHARELAVE